MAGPGSFFGIEISRRGIMAHRKSLETTGHNVSNASNPEYSRQEAVHSASDPYAVPSISNGPSPGQMGSGVEIEEVRRIRNEYLDTQVRDSTSAKEFYNSRQKILEQVESVFPEPNGRGIQEVMVDFFSDWHDLNNSPQDAGIKSAVVESGKELSRMFRETHRQLKNVEEGILGKVSDGDTIKEGKIGTQIEKINDITTQIKDVTESIIKVNRNGQQPNDLLDKRDALLDELSQYGPVKVEEVGEHGGIDVTMFPGETGEKLVSTSSGNNEVSRNEVSAEYDNGDIYLNIDGSQEVTLTDDSLINNGNGSLLGNISAWKDVIENDESIINQINSLGRTLGDTVNATYNPHNEWPQNFFVFEDTSGDEVTGEERTAAHIRVNEDLINDSSKLDGEQALDVARLRNKSSLLNGALKDVNNNGWNLTATAESSDGSLKGLEIKFSDGSNGINATYDSGTIEVTADWASDVDAPTLSEIQDEINKTINDENSLIGYVNLEDGNGYTADDLDDAGSLTLNDNMKSLGDSTFEEYYESIISEIGSKVDSAKNMTENQDAILGQAENLRESASGVSLDEELSRMIQYQRGYQASARVMTTIDSLLDKLINGTAV